MAAPPLLCTVFPPAAAPLAKVGQCFAPVPVFASPSPRVGRAPAPWRALFCGGAVLVASLGAVPALAQVESFILQPGSEVGPGTKVKPKNCVTSPDGTISCDTQIVNPPGHSPAKPQYSPFKN